MLIIVKQLLFLKLFLIFKIVLKITKTFLFLENKYRIIKVLSYIFGLKFVRNFTLIFDVLFLEWLKAPEFVPRSRQFLDNSFHPDGMIFANNLLVNSINGTVLPNNILSQQAQTHIVAGIPFSPVGTVLDLPQPIMSTQSKQ